MVVDTFVNMLQQNIHDLQFTSLVVNKINKYISGQRSSILHFDLCYLKNKYLKKN